MTYELAKKLKEAGFPNMQKLGCTVCGDFNPSKLYDWSPERIEKARAEHQKLNRCDGGYLMPRLEELIEACGDKLYSIERSGGGMWCAEARDKNTDQILSCQDYPTIIEAVANLWLALNEKTQ